jgi:hypothetical protein
MSFTATGRRLNHNSILEPDRNGPDAKARLFKDVQRQNMLDKMSECEETSALKRSYREQATRQREQEINDSIIRAQTDKLLRQQAYEQEEKLARELERIKLEKLRDEKMRQQLKQTSYELRELESKLREAYVSKERHAQMAEKEAHKFDDMIEDAQIMKRMKEEAERAEQHLKEKEIIKHAEKLKYKEDLTKQLEEKEYARQKAYEEFLKEKLMIDEIVRKLYEEDQREIERKMLQKKATREYIDEFKRQRELWKQRERDIMEEENKKIMEYASVQRERDDSMKAFKEAKEKAMNELQRKLFKQIEKERESREEMERVRQELYLEEQEQLARHHERNELERKLRQRIELKREYETQIEMKQVREHEQQLEEERIKQQMLEKFANDDKIELMNAQKRRMKQLEHKRAVEALLDERRQRMNDEKVKNRIKKLFIFVLLINLILNLKQRELQERIESEKLDAYRRKIIEEERIRLLKEHATKLLGYLPKGVIRDESDLDAMGVEFKDEFKRRQIDFFNDDKAWYP